MRDFMWITKALSDPTRVRILMALRDRELCVCQVTEMFGMAPSTVSKHLSVLFNAGLVKSRKADRWVYYSLPGGEAGGVVRSTFTWMAKALAQDPQIIADTRQIKGIMKMDLAKICKSQCPA